MAAMSRGSSARKDANTNMSTASAPTPPINVSASTPGPLPLPVPLARASSPVTTAVVPAGALADIAFCSSGSVVSVNDVGSGMNAYANVLRPSAGGKTASPVCW